MNKWVSNQLRSKTTDVSATANHIVSIDLPTFTFDRLNPASAGTTLAVKGRSGKTAKIRQLAIVDRIRYLGHPGDPGGQAQ